MNALERELAFTRHTLAYRLGVAIVEHLTPTRLWKLPAAVIAALVRYRKERGNDIGKPQVLVRSLPSNPNWPVPVERHLLWQAQHIATVEGARSACEYVETYGDDRHQPGLKLLRSNASLDDDRQWLSGLNAYLGSFGQASLELGVGSSPRFFRLQSSFVDPVPTGPLVTVIMPAFNAEGTLALAVRSILNQTWQSLELIVIDDASTDATFEVAVALEQEDSRVRCYRNSVNVGPYVSKNRALDLARGDYITGHDADDWAHPQRLELQIEQMLANPSWQVSIGYMLRLREDGAFSHFSKMGRTSPDGAARLASISCIFRSTFLRDLLGHWDSVRFGADSEMIERCRCILPENGFGTSNIVTMLCLDGEGSLTNDPQHGISKLTGVSPTREYYRQQWSDWHDGLAPEAAYLGFPQQSRKFAAPAEAEVSETDILRVVSIEVSHRN